MEQHLAVELGSHEFYYPNGIPEGRQNKGDSHARGGKRVVDKNTLMLLFFILDVITLNVTNNNKYINTLSK